MNLIYKTLGWGRKWLVDLNVGKTQQVSFEQSKNIVAIDVKMNGSVLEDKLPFNGIDFGFLIGLGSYIIFIVETSFKKIGALICRLLCISINLLCGLDGILWSCLDWCL